MPGYVASDVTAPDARDGIPAAAAQALDGIATVTSSAAVVNAILYIDANAPAAPERLTLHAALAGPTGAQAAGQQVYAVTPAARLRCPVAWVHTPPTPDIRRLELRYDTTSGASEARIVTSAPALFDRAEDDYLDAWRGWHMTWRNGAFSEAIDLRRPGAPHEDQVAGEHIYRWPLAAHRLADLSLADARRTDAWTVFLYRYA